MGAVADVVEGDLSCLVVQEDPDAPGPHTQGQGGAGYGQGLVDAPIQQPQHPVTIVGGEEDRAFPGSSLLAQPQAPLRLISHLHLPVVAAREEARSAQHHWGAAEPLGVVKEGQKQLPAPTSDTLAVLRHSEIWVCRLWVQNHIHWRERERDGRTDKASGICRHRHKQVPVAWMLGSPKLSHIPQLFAHGFAQLPELPGSGEAQYRKSAT